MSNTHKGQRKGGRGGRRKPDPMNKLSRLLSGILRHWAGVKNGYKHLQIRADAYVPLTQISQLPDVQRILNELGKEKTERAYLPVFESLVKNCQKQRFSLIQKKKTYFIRANQGHSEEVAAFIKQDKLLEKWAPTGKVPTVNGRNAVVHGTYKKAVDLILLRGPQQNEARAHTLY